MFRFGAPQSSKAFNQSMASKGRFKPSRPEQPRALSESGNVIPPRHNHRPKIGFRKASGIFRQHIAATQYPFNILILFIKYPPCTDSSRGPTDYKPSNFNASNWM
jgi:hypothetical protein